MSDFLFVLYVFFGTGMLLIGIANAFWPQTESGEAPEARARWARAAILAPVWPIALAVLIVVLLRRFLWRLILLALGKG